MTKLDGALKILDRVSGKLEVLKSTRKLEGDPMFISVVEDIATLKDVIASTTQREDKAITFLRCEDDSNKSN